ncbi:transglutaminase [Geothermobacter hydrogeniphilus]|uniref:Transglutaminase n=1 Tax=Geothermobacter hydrogeniphilus TaxID=1969733 RepID=A0A2K2HCE7_9BACT|nr:transglutaminase domain-containing protein [Geothermobacter hydrogeniphilus]PNU20976.1 transglutaminase [Geothermobacter hydrogeniphilus]
MKRLVFLLLILLLGVSSAWGKTVSGEVVMTFDLSGQQSGREARLWIPYPISDANQLISDIHWEGNYSEAAVYTDRENSIPILYARWAADADSRRLTLRFKAERREQLRRDIPRADVPLDRAAFSRYLGATSMGPIDGPVKALTDQIVAGKKTNLEKARAIYDWTVDNTFRDPNTRGCGLGNVPRLLDRPGGKCADISSIYVALARSAGIPAREILGIRLGKKDGQDITGWQHCWAEFYQPGYGWVPVDPADVRKAMLKQNLKLDDPQVAKLREDFWGGVDAYRVRLSEGRDIELNPPQQGPAVNYLMYPFAQVGGKTLDWLDPKTFSYQITYRQ